VDPPINELQTCMTITWLRGAQALSRRACRHSPVLHELRGQFYSVLHELQLTLVKPALI